MNESLSIVDLLQCVLLLLSHLFNRHLLKHHDKDLFTTLVSHFFVDLFTVLLSPQDPLNQVIFGMGKGFDHLFESFEGSLG